MLPSLRTSPLIHQISRQRLAACLNVPSVCSSSLKHYNRAFATVNPADNKAVHEKGVTDHKLPQQTAAGTVPPTTTPVTVTGTASTHTSPYSAGTGIHHPQHASSPPSPPPPHGSARQDLDEDPKNEKQSRRALLWGAAIFFTVLPVLLYFHASIETTAKTEEAQRAVKYVEFGKRYTQAKARERGQASHAAEGEEQEQQE